MNIALVAGGTGTVGEGIVKFLLENDWTVVVPGRDQLRLEALKKYCNNHPKLHLHRTDVSNPDVADAFFSDCHGKYGPFDMIVATLGGWRQGTPLTSLSWGEWQSVLSDNLSSHFLVIRHGVPILKPGGVYVHINGLGAEAVIPTAGPVVAAASAQQRLVLTLAEEQNNTGRKVYELVLGLVNTRARNIKGEMGEQLINPLLVGKFILQLWRSHPAITGKVVHYLRDAHAVSKLLHE